LNPHGPTKTTCVVSVEPSTENNPEIWKPQNSVLRAQKTHKTLLKHMKCPKDHHQAQVPHQVQVHQPARKQGNHKGNNNNNNRMKTKMIKIAKKDNDKGQEQAHDDPHTPDQAVPNQTQSKDVSKTSISPSPKSEAVLADHPDQEDTTVEVEATNKEEDMHQDVQG